MAAASQEDADAPKAEEAPKKKFNPWNQVCACARRGMHVRCAHACTQRALTRVHVWACVYAPGRAYSHTHPCKQEKAEVPNKHLRDDKIAENRGKENCLQGMTFVITGVPAFRLSVVCLFRLCSVGTLCMRDVRVPPTCACACMHAGCTPGARTWQHEMLGAKIH